MPRGRLTQPCSPRMRARLAPPYPPQTPPGTPRPPTSTPALLPHIARLQPSNPCHLVAVVHNINAGLRNHTFLNHLQQAANVPTLVSARSGAQWG